MHSIEHYYNILYYFFYRGFIKFSVIISVPVFSLYFFIYKIPYIKKRFEKKGIDNPLQWHKQKYKEEFLENPVRSLGTIVGGGIAISVLGFVYLGIWHIIRNYFFPTHQNSLAYSLIIIGLLAYTTDNLLVTQHDQGQKYIKKFNKKTGWWRIKWAIITALSPIFAIWFAIITSSYGSVGQYILNLNGYTKSDINHLIYKKQLNTPVTKRDLNKTKQNEQDLLNEIRKHSPSRAQ